MRYLTILFIFFPLSLLADTTGNLLNQNFNTSSWSGTNKTSRHGNGTIAGVNDKYVESTISLSDTLTESQINGGWTSTLGADIWHWNNLNSTTIMKQTITDTDGTITTQIRNVANTGCGYINCGDWATYTDSYTQGINSQSDYDIAVRFTFEESNNSSSHYATDLKNPILTIEHSLLNATQLEEITTIAEDVEELIEEVPEMEELITTIAIEQFEYIPIQEEINITEFIEIFAFDQTTEEINTGIVNIFFEEIPMEEFYEETTTTIDIPIGSFQEVSEETEIGETIGETSDTSGETINLARGEEETTGSAREETAGTGTGNTPAENERGTSSELGQTSESEEEPSGNNAGEQEEITVAETETTESESSSERGSTTEQSEESNTSEESTDRTSETETSEQDIDTDSQSSETTIADFSVEKIREKVGEVIKEIDKQLVVTNIIVAKSMKSGLDINTYSQVNSNIFNNQPIMNGGEYSDILEYIDNRNIYQQSQVMYNDDYSKYQKEVDDAKANTIRAEEHLRRIRGY